MDQRVQQTREGSRGRGMRVQRAAPQVVSGVHAPDGKGGGGRSLTYHNSGRDVEVRHRGCGTSLTQGRGGGG